MYLLPYLLEKPKVSSSEFTLHTLWLFLAKGGQALWKVETSDLQKKPQVLQKEYLEENGIFGTITCVKGDILYFCVDSNKTKRNDFYNWLDEGVTEETEVWRPFFWIEDTQKESTPWGWKGCAESHLLHIDSGMTSKVQKMIQKLSLQDVWEVVLNK